MLRPPQLVIFLENTPTGSTARTFRKNSGKTPETLSERFLEFPSRARLGSPKRYSSGHLRLPEHFQNSLPPSTAGGASFFQKRFQRGLSELVLEFQAVLRAFLKFSSFQKERKKVWCTCSRQKLVHMSHAGNRRKPQISAENRRFSQKTADFRRLGSVTLGPSPLARPYCR